MRLTTERLADATELLRPHQRLADATEPLPTTADAPEPLQGLQGLQAMKASTTSKQGGHPLKVEPLQVLQARTLDHP